MKEEERRKEKREKKEKKERKERGGRGGGREREREREQQSRVCWESRGVARSRGHPSWVERVMARSFQGHDEVMSSFLVVYLLETKGGGALRPRLSVPPSHREPECYGCR